MLRVCYKTNFAKNTFEKSRSDFKKEYRFWEYAVLQRFKN